MRGQPQRVNRRDLSSTKIFLRMNCAKPPILIVAIPLFLRAIVSLVSTNLFYVKWVVSICHAPPPNGRSSSEQKVKPHFRFSKDELRDTLLYGYLELGRVSEVESKFGGFLGEFIRSLLQ